VASGSLEMAIVLAIFYTLHHLIKNGCRSHCCGKPCEVDGDDDPPHNPQSTPIHIRRSISEHGTETLELV